MSEKIASALNYHFDKHRIVFWYDEGGKLRDVYESYSVPEGGEKVEIEGNEFELKYRMLKEQPENKFLAYSSSPKPPDEENWLLDLNLAYFVFASNEAAMVQQELEVPDNFLPIIEEHLSFFRNVHERFNPLKTILRPNAETEESFLLAMMSALCGGTRESKGKRKSFPEIVINVFIDTLVREEPFLWSEIERHTLSGFFWKSVESEFGYDDDTPTIEGFLYYILRSVFAFQLEREQTRYSRYMFTSFDTWRKHQDYKPQVQELLDKMEKELNIAHEVENITDLSELARLDIFKEADRQIFSRLLEAVLNDSIDYSDALEIIEGRRESYWYKSGDSDRLTFHYKTLYYYLRFTEKLSRLSINFGSVRDGWDAYTREYYEIDGDYRRFLFACYESESTSLFSGLLDKINSEYTEAYLQPLADAWQKSLDNNEDEGIFKSYRMSAFFSQHIRPYLDKDRSVFIIISDGLRFELGVELGKRLEQMNRFKVEVSNLAAPVPTYTQIGMASLLPHTALRIADDGNTVLADGMSTAGLDNRGKVIQKWLDEKYKEKKARVINADSFMDMPRAEQGDFIRGIDIVLLYSSGVDAVGDDVKKELRLPRAADDEIQKLENICSHIGNNLSRTHIIITADHGFLYRYREVPETERARIEKGEGEVRRDHRFIFAAEPVPHPSADILDKDAVEWTAPFTVQCARGVSRIRRPGGGTRYVHGGRMPQELCVPLLFIRKSRVDDVEKVDVAVLDRQNQITTGQITVAFFQEQPVEVKRPARQVEAVFEGDDGKEISNKAHLIFDSGESNEQNRSRKVAFIFTREADAYNGKYVSLKLYDVKAGGVRTFYREYTYYFQKRLHMDVDF